MTIDEKLQHFYEISVEEAKEDAAKAIQEHKEHLAQMLEEHKSSRIQSAEAEVKAEAGHVRREVNKALSAEQLTLKRDWSQKQEELKTDLFAKVRKKLELFMSTPEYTEYLCRQVRKVKEFAGEDQVEISLSPEDKDLAGKVSGETGVPLTVSEESFLGGIRAAIPHKNILIDNSFQEGLNTLRREFKFEGGLKHE
ncbi:MAG TPA: V-type ATP synthase subunit E [Candidatus Blautia intestinipullorum]|nr:V-type ATP synthase subunit E [Candidatus Blautia intestinipullorum]